MKRKRYSLLDHCPNTSKKSKNKVTQSEEKIYHNIVDAILKFCNNKNSQKSTLTNLYEKIVDDIRYHNTLYTDSDISKWTIRLVTQRNVNNYKNNEILLYTNLTYCLFMEDIKGKIIIAADDVMMNFDSHYLSAPEVESQEISQEISREIGISIYNSNNIFLGRHYNDKELEKLHHKLNPFSDETMKHRATVKNFEIGICVNNTNMVSNILINNCNIINCGIGLKLGSDLLPDILLYDDGLYNTHDNYTITYNNNNNNNTTDTDTSDTSDNNNDTYHPKRHRNITIGSNRNHHSPRKKRRLSI